MEASKMIGEAKQYISWATDFDAYKGTACWQELPLSDRKVIVKHLLTDQPEDLDIHAFVMGTKLRRIQYDGLVTVITRTALTLEHDAENIDYSKVLPHLSGTALGQELASLIDGTATPETNYRMGELEFLAQSGSKTSPLDRLLDLPIDLRLGAIVQLLKPKGAFAPRPRPPEDPNTMPFIQVIPLINRKEVQVHAGYSGSLQAASVGLIKLGTVGKLTNLGFMISPVAGIAAAIFISWWLLPVGILGAIACFKYTRRTASHAVLRKALSNEAFFDEMRKRHVLWLEYTSKHRHPEQETE
jgi:hypothetical protein